MEKVQDDIWFMEYHTRGLIIYELHSNEGKKKTLKETPKFVFRFNEISFALKFLYLLTYVVAVVISHSQFHQSHD